LEKAKRSNEKDEAAKKDALAKEKVDKARFETEKAKRDEHALELEIKFEQQMAEALEKTKELQE